MSQSQTKWKNWVNFYFNTDFRNEGLRLDLLVWNSNSNSELLIRKKASDLSLAYC